MAYENVSFRPVNFGGSGGNRFGSFSDKMRQKARDEENDRRYAISQARLAQQDKLAADARAEAARRFDIQEARLSKNANKAALEKEQIMKDALAADQAKNTIDSLIPKEKLDVTKAEFDEGENPYDIARAAVNKKFGTTEPPIPTDAPINMEDDSTARQQHLMNKVDPAMEKKRLDALKIIDADEKANAAKSGLVPKTPQELAAEQIAAYQKASQDKNVPLATRYALSQASKPQTLSQEDRAKVAVDRLKKINTKEVDALAKKDNNLTPSEIRARKKMIAEAKAVVAHGDDWFNDDDSLEYKKAKAILDTFGIE